MSGLTQYAAKKLLDHMLDTASFTAPSPAYLSLHTAGPTDSGSHANEVSTSGTGYARQSLASKMGAADLTSGVATNTATVTFGPALTSWGTLTHLAVEDAATVGNMLAWGLPSEAKNIGIGQSFQFAASQFSIELD